MASAESSFAQVVERDCEWGETVFMPDFVFGYGSLVNALTHSFADVRPAKVLGWRRRWCQREDRPWAFLAVRPVESAMLSGVIARVPANDWEALDEREASYQRGLVEVAPATSAAMYWVADETFPPVTRPRPILLSYLDVCVEGYQSVFGPKGHLPFFDTTDGWDLPIVDDRSAPIYARHTKPGSEVLASTDKALANLGVLPKLLSAVMKELE